MARGDFAVHNPQCQQRPARVGIAWSIENPVGEEGRQAAFREVPGLSGLYMDNPFLASFQSLKGTFALGAVGAPGGKCFLSARLEEGWLVGWSADFLGRFQRRWRAGLHFPVMSPVGSLAVTQTIPARERGRVTFLLAWHFPNRTPDRCGWPAPESVPKTTVVGNAYTERFADAWDVSRQAAAQLPQLEARTRAFAQAIESSTLPPAVLDAATSTLSTLRMNTCFRTPGRGVSWI